MCNISIFCVVINFSLKDAIRNKLEKKARGYDG
jgi:hypothetical protein